MADWDFILAPATVQVRVFLNETLTVINSLRLLNVAHMYSGLAAWVLETVNDMGDERLQKNAIVAEVADSAAILSSAISSQQNLSFPDYLRELEAAEPQVLRDSMLEWVREKDEYPGDDVLLASEVSYVRHMRELLAHKIDKGYEFNEEMWSLRYHYMMRPDELHTETVNHLHYMWDTYLKDEWRRVRPTLEEAVNAFSQLDFSNMTGFDAIEAITGRNMRGKEGFDEMVSQAEILNFVPSAHLGPYIGWGPTDTPQELVFVFGARLPENTQVNSLALSRSELLVRLNALADETRLRILELLTQHHELCAQDFITTLDLSQSSASRHLRQLTASGYLVERRRDVAKCYTLNPERIDDTIRALKEFLHIN